MKPKHKINLLKMLNTMYKFKNEHKNDFTVHYKCKIKNIPSKMYISNQNVMIKQKNIVKEFKIKEIKQVKYRVKTWSIEVEIDTVREHYKCHFSKIRNAKACYEYLIYQKVRAEKN